MLIINLINNNSLNPLKTRKSFRQTGPREDRASDLKGLNPLKTRKSFRQKLNG